MINKVVVAMDSFKGSVSAQEAVDSCAEGVLKVLPSCKVLRIPLADGGEGFARISASQECFARVSANVCGPLGNNVIAYYYYDEQSHTAVMELAQACGLTLIPHEKRNPLKTSSFGLGEMISNAIERGARKIILGIGGSATNDVGMGMLCGLGWRFEDAQGNILRGCGENLINVDRIISDNVNVRLKNMEFIVACDVNNPLYGPNGATLVYGPQKGADNTMLNCLEEGVKHFSDKVYSDVANYNSDFISMPGAGAAGGIGAALSVFLNAKLMPGIETTLLMQDFDTKIEDADLVITGEGSIDEQSVNGKVISGVAHHARLKNIPVIAIGGQVEHNNNINDMGILAYMSIINKPMSLSECINSSITKNNIFNTTIQVINLINHFTQRNS